MKQNAKQEQMVIALASEIGLPFQVWHDEKQQWFKSESNEPIRDRDIPRPTRPCSVSIQAGYQGKYLRFRMRGQVSPTTEAAQDANL